MATVKSLKAFESSTGDNGETITYLYTTNRHHINLKQVRNTSVYLLWNLFWLAGYGLMVSCSTLKMWSLSASKICVFVQSVDYHFLSGLGFFFSWIIEVLGLEQIPQGCWKGDIILKLFTRMVSVSSRQSSLRNCHVCSWLLKNKEKHFNHLILTP